MNEVRPVPPCEPPDVQSAAEVARTPSKGIVKVDTLAWVQGRPMVFGWCSAPDLDLALDGDDGPIPVEAIRFDRPDVRASLGTDDENLGFLVYASRARPAGAVRLSLGGGTASAPLVPEERVPEHATAHAIGAIVRTFATLAPGSGEWRALLALIPEGPRPSASTVAGHLDTLIVAGSAGAVASGWVSHGEDVHVWIEDDTGRAQSLDAAFRLRRDDVRTHGPATARVDPVPGFLVHLPRFSRARAARIAGVCGAVRFAFEWQPATEVPESGALAGMKLSEIPCPRRHLPDRFRRVDLPFIGRIRECERARWRQHAPRPRWHGPRPEAPDISLIVPLYGRYDLIEHQLLEFTVDPDFGSRVELLYVIDDPGIENAVETLAPRLHDILGVPFATVPCVENTGFSAANNRGAALARGETLVFMNSDVFPIAPGWLDRLVAPLEDGSVGLVGPRLLFPDGGIQHAGMVPRWRPALGLWTNHHPMMGFDPALDPAVGLMDTALVTGACFAIRKAFFDEIGGWCTDYIVGDFEDSDLCFRVAEAGRRVVHLPDVSLIHMERQSVAEIGEAGFREWVTLLNATLYNARWADRLHDMARADGT